MLLKDLKNKRVAVWGLGSEGLSIRNWLEKHRWAKEIMTYEDSQGPGALEDVLSRADVIIRSPGVSIYKPEIALARDRGVKITSGTDLFFNEMRRNHPKTTVIAVSGSKGKSMSVSLLFHIMLHAGRKVALGGNIGKPLVDLLDDEYDYVICEVSSYQASDLTASPQIVMFTNLFSVHTDWHGGHEQYCLDKLRLAAHQKNGDLCLINDRNPQLKEFAARAGINNGVLYNVWDAFHAEGRELYYQHHVLLNIEQLQICGNHNLDNLAGVITIAKHLGLNVEQALNSLSGFEPLPHRLQKVGSVNGVMFINDSISTAPEAAVGAMASFDNNLAIISGGIENQQDYTEYARFIQNNSKVKAAVTLFQCGRQIADAIRREVTREDFKLIEAETLEEAVTRAYYEIKAAGGDLVLFSPTAPSFGYYKNFMERGNHFINIVKKLG